MSRARILVLLLAWLPALGSAAQDVQPLYSIPSSTAWISSVAFSPDGKTLASCHSAKSGDGSNWIKYWDATTGVLLRVTSRGHSLWLHEAAFSPDGTMLATGSADDAIKIWDPDTGALLRTLRGHSSDVLSNAFSPDGKTLASGCEDHKIKLWDPGTGAVLRTLVGHASDVFSVAFSPDGETLASGSRDRSIMLWDVATGAVLRTLSGHADWVVSVAFSPDGKTLASGSRDDTIMLWDPTSGTVLRTLSGHTDYVEVVAFSPNGKILASGSSDRTIKLWDFATGTLLHTIPVSAGRVQSIAFSPDGKKLVSGSYENGVCLWDLEPLLPTNQEPTASFTWAALSSSGARLFVEPRGGDLIQFDASASSDADGTIAEHEWDWTTDGVYEAASASAVAEYRFAEAGSYQVTLRVTDDDGATATITQTVGIGAKSLPLADFTSSPASPSTLDVVQLADASSDADGQITAWAWDFGDGATSAEQDPTHTYASSGTFPVVLTVTDNDGLTGTKTAEITVAAAPAGVPRFDEQWALVIGVAEYEDPAILDLKYTAADAQSFYDFISDPQGGGFSNDHVRLLLNDQATTAAVKGAFRWLIQQSEEDDLVVIYFAGHGGTAPDLSQPPDEADGVDEYLVTYDARSDDLFSTAVRDDEVGDWLASFRSKNVVVILDSCFAAGSTRSLQQEGTRAGPGNQVFTDLVGAGRLFLAASREAEVSYEDAALGHGVFTYYLLLGLGAGRTSPEADVDGDGRVTVKELETYLEREVSRERNQHPLVTGDLTITRAALGGYGVPLVGEVTAIQGDTVLISLGSRHGVQVGDQFQVVRSYSVPGGATLAEVRALIEVVGVLDADRAACRVVQLFFPIEVKDAIRPVQ